MTLRLVLLLLSMTAAAVVVQSPFACDPMALSAQARKRRFDELGPKLRTFQKHVRELPDGYEFEFPVEASPIVWEWIEGERLCCPFFDIGARFEREHGGFWLRLTGREGVKAFVRSDFAPWFQAAK